MQVSFGNRKIATAQSLKFLGLTIDTTLTWKNHTGELTYRMKKACYAIRSIKPFMSLDVLRSTYFSYAHSILSYGIIFWRNSSYSDDIFKMQKRIIRIIMNSSRNASCWQLFKELNILPIQSQYTGCPRRNGQNFGRVFLMLNYTNITQNTYIQSLTGTEIMVIEKCGLLGCPRTVRCP